MKRLLIFLAIVTAIATGTAAAATATATDGVNSSKLVDETTPPGLEGNNCGGCSTCECPQSPPPPPRHHKKPRTPPGPYCPPPPPSLIYIPGPPGNLYPVNPYFAGTGRLFAIDLPLLATSGLLGLLAFW